jgi:hypothetical protein
MEVGGVIGRGPWRALCRGLLAAALISIGSVSATADKPMNFVLVQAGTLFKSIYAAGDITAYTPGKFSAFLKSSGVTAPATVYLSSAGGDLMAGLALGRAIRAAGFGTEVGIPAPGRIEPAACDSACTFVFLGGVTRTVSPGSFFGVHRFSGNDADPLQAAQEIGGQLVAYMDEMHVSPDLYTQMTEGSPEQVKYLDAATMAKLRVTTTETVRGRMNFDAGYPVLVVRDLQGAVQYGRLDFFCRGGKFIARGYFPERDPVLDETGMVLAWTFYRQGGTQPDKLAVPAADAAIAGATGGSGSARAGDPVSGQVAGQVPGQVIVDVNVQPAVLNDGILKAQSVWLTLQAPGEQAVNDTVGLGTAAIPTPTKEMMQTLARGC